MFDVEVSRGHQSNSIGLHVSSSLHGGLTLDMRSENDFRVWPLFLDDRYEGGHCHQLFTSSGSHVGDHQ